MTASREMALSVCLLCFTSARAQAAAPVEVDKNAGAMLFVDAPRAKNGFAIHLADTLTVTVQIDDAKTLDVKAPTKITKSPGWRLLAVTPATALDQNNKRVVWQQTYTFEPLAPGALTLALEPFVVSARDITPRTLTWRPLLIRVSTDVTSADVRALRDPVVIEKLPPAEKTEQWPWLMGGAVCLGALLAVIGYLFWQRRSRRSAGTAEERALRQLERIATLHLPERREFGRFHTLLANVLRRYLERKHHLPARHRTTREFLELVNACSALADSDKAFLQAFFTSCDLAKFARADVSREECATRAAQARSFILGTPSTPPSGGMSMLPNAADSRSQAICGQTPPAK